MDQDETWRGGRRRPRPHYVRWRPSSPQRGTAPNFRPMSIVAKRLCGLRCHLVWRSASAQATLCKMGTQLSPKRGHSPHFSTISTVAKRLDGSRCHLVWKQALAHATLCQMETQLSPEGHSPQFSAHVRCGQTAGWIKMPLGMEVGLGQGDIVLDGTQLPPPKKKGTQSPIFAPCLLWPNGCVD